MLDIIMPMDFSVRVTLIVKYDGVYYHATIKQFPEIMATKPSLAEAIAQVKVLLSRYMIEGPVSVA